VNIATAFYAIGCSYGSFASGSDGPFDSAYGAWKSRCTGSFSESVKAGDSLRSQASSSESQWMAASEHDIGTYSELY